MATTELKTSTHCFSTNESVKMAPNKRPTSFSIDTELMIQFKTECVHLGRPMSSVIEELMLQFINRKKL